MPEDATKRNIDYVDNKFLTPSEVNIDEAVGEIEWDYNNACGTFSIDVSTAVSNYLVLAVRSGTTVHEDLYDWARREHNGVTFKFFEQNEIDKFRSTEPSGEQILIILWGASGYKFRSKNYNGLKELREYILKKAKENLRDDQASKKR